MKSVDRRKLLLLTGAGAGGFALSSAFHLSGANEEPQSKSSQVKASATNPKPKSHKPSQAKVSAPNAMQMLSEMVIDTKFKDLPSEAVNHAKRNILDTLAVTVGGSAMEGIEATVDLIKDKGGKPESYIPFYGGKVPASEAAFAIGPMARAMDFGDLHFVIGHCNEYILPALMAATGLKAKVSGKDFIEAFIVGAEVLFRIGLYAQPGITMNFGRDGGHYIFGCVAAVGKLLGLTLDELQHAQGIASGMTQPHSLLMYTPATLMIRLHHGFICQDAINACLLAKEGITGPTNGVLSSPAGYSNLVKWDADLKDITNGLGKDWLFADLSMKAFPIAGSAQTIISGMSEQMSKHSFSGQDIDRIELVLDQKLADRVLAPDAFEAQWHPQSPHDCQFSVPYGVASFAYDGELFLDSYTAEARSRKDIRKLMTNVSVSSDPKLGAYTARINTTLKNGKAYTGTYLYPKGHPKNRLKTKEIADKFRKCAGYSAFPLKDNTVDTVIDNVLALEKFNDVVSSIIEPLTPM